MLRQLLLCANVHGNGKCLDWLRRTAQTRKPDAVVFAGGVLAPTRQYSGHVTPWDMTAADARFLDEFFETLGNLRTFCAIVPGPHDFPLSEFLRFGMRAEVEYPGLHVVHGTLVETANSAWCGMGGSIAEKEALELEVCSRTIAEFFLRSLWSSQKPRKILVIAAPPRGPLGGKEGRGFVGDWIDSYHPDLCVVGGSTPARGTQQIAHTLVVNPGCLADGSAAWLDWRHSGPEAIEFLNRQNGELVGTRRMADAFQ